ncbi:MAG: type II/IV secretion system protein, partial [Pseudomonadota bacterium]|nr:type II/IV secretion system protein [Pseudomonadota bacterium]
MQATPDRVINLSTLVSDLHRDGLLTEDDHQLALTIRRGADEAALHPLTLIARQRYKDARADGKVLTEHALIEWLGERESMDVINIDPLEINVSAVTEVMSYAFSERHKIL